MPVHLNAPDDDPETRSIWERFLSGYADTIVLMAVGTLFVIAAAVAHARGAF